MANETPNYNLHRPVRGEPNWNDSLNENFEIIDTTLNIHNTSLNDIARLTNPKDYSNSAIITWIDDDCYNTITSRLALLANTKGIKLTIGIVTSKIDTYLGYSDTYKEDLTYADLNTIKTLQSQGHEIISHSATHPTLTNIVYSDWDNDLSISKAFMQTNGFNDELIVLPNGYVGMTDTARIVQLKSISRKYYKYAFNSGLSYNILPVDNYEVQRLNIDDMTLTAIESAVDNAIANNAWLVFMTHSGLKWNALGQNRQQVYSDLIDYINSKGVPIMIASEALKKVGNIVASGDTRTGNYKFVSNNGQSTDFKVIDKSQQAVVDFNKLITDYVQYTETIEYVKDTNDTLTGLGGKLTTYRGAKFYSYQTFQPVQSNKIFRRFWSESGSGSWGEWYIIANPYIKNGSITMSTPISSFPMYSHTIAEIYYTGDTLLNLGGTMDTYRGTNDDFSYQIYRPYTKNALYMRKWDKSGLAWLPWSKISSGDTITTATRPTNLQVGSTFFDTTLGKPIWLKTAPSTWVDATGTVV